MARKTKAQIAAEEEAKAAAAAADADDGDDGDEDAVTEVDDDEVELEELADEPDTEETTKTKSKLSSAQEVTFGVKDLCDYISKKLNKEYSTRDLRTLIRKMAREDKPRVQREVVAGNRTRYDWPKGLKDPEVKAILAAVGAGEVEEGKKEALNALKEKKAQDKANGVETKGGKKKGKHKTKS